MAKFQKGQSGNPNGRPQKSRALTEILEAAGNKTIDYQGRRAARKRVLASLLWEATTTGSATLPDGTVLELGASDWFAVVKMLYSQIDGPPPQRQEHTGADGGPIRTVTEVVIGGTPIAGQQATGTVLDEPS